MQGLCSANPVSHLDAVSVSRGRQDAMSRSNIRRADRLHCTRRIGTVARKHRPLFMGAALPRGRSAAKSTLRSTTTRPARATRPRMGWWRRTIASTTARVDGKIQVGGDEGIRTHGSVDYMSIMRRHSHGCHRMHNHIAVRLMSFVLEHRPHTRYGQQPMVYRREFEFEEVTVRHGVRQGWLQLRARGAAARRGAARPGSRPSQRADRGRVAAVRP